MASPCTLKNFTPTVRSKTNHELTRIMKALLTVLSISSLSQLTLMAETQRSDSFAEASRISKASSQPYAIFIHGSSWHALSDKYRSQLWNSDQLESALTKAVTLSEIHVRQNLDKDAQKKFTDAHKGWQIKSVKSYPAIQIFAADGSLLKTYQGKEMRLLTSPQKLAKHIDYVSEAASQRRTLWTQIEAADKAGDSKLAIYALTSLSALPINHDKRTIESLKKHDPSDQSGWQDKLNFKEWDFVRNTHKLLKDSKSKEAQKLVDSHLSNPLFTPSQRSLILCSRALIELKGGNKEDASKTFEEAYQLDPTGANGKSVRAYADMVLQS